MIFFDLVLAEDESLLREGWMRSLMGEEEIGWVHEQVFQFEKDGQTFFRILTETEMEMKRFGQGVKISVKGESIEDADGHVVEMHQETMMSTNVTKYDLYVEGDKAKVTITTMGTPRESTIDWSPDILGGMGVDKLRREKGFEPGSVYTYKTFLFDYMQAGTLTVEGIGFEETEMLDGEKRRFFKSKTEIDLLPGIPTYEWSGEDFMTYKTSVSMMGLDIKAFRTTKERATMAAAEEMKLDVIIETMATSNVNIPVPYKLDSILYRFKAKDKELGLPDNMNRLTQEVIEQKDGEAIIRISAKVPDSTMAFPLENPPEELAEFLEPNAYIQSDHPPLREKALEIVKGETDAWAAACKLESFVYKHIKDKNFGTGFASAAEVFENPTGDCSEHAVLLAAVCRAVGIPARAAMGYMYLGGIFGGHVWVEVWINGKWYAIDGVMGIGRVDPTHITFSDSSLKQGGLALSFADAMRGLGNVDLEILEFTRDGKVIKVGKEGFKEYAIDGNTFTNTLYGISITKPDGFEFKDYIKDYSGPDFKLVDIRSDDSKVRLEARPAVFSFSYDELRESIKARGLEIKSETEKLIGGQKGKIYACEDDGSKKERIQIMGLIHQDTCYVLAMEIENEEADVAVFNGMVDSIRFSN